MKKLFIIANWKANKTTADANEWFKGLAQVDYSNYNLDSKEIIICPPLLLVPAVKTLISSLKIPKLKLKLGVQDISSVKEGAFTGENPVRLVQEFAEYAIIGHSERRKNFNENDDLLMKKILNAYDAEITPVFCVQDENTFIPEKISLIAYEPVFAIGTSNPDTPENAERVTKLIREKNKIIYSLYGGSVTPDNVNSFTRQEHIDGVLVGGASLDPVKFSGIIINS